MSLGSRRTASARRTARGGSALGLARARGFAIPRRSLRAPTIASSDDSSEEAPTGPSLLVRGSVVRGVAAPAPLLERPRARQRPPRPMPRLRERARTRRLGARRARRRSRRSRARRPRASSARPSSSPSRFPRRWRATPRGPPPPDPGPPFRRVTPPRVSVQTTPSPRRAARRRATGTRPRARRSSPPLALASVPSFGATRRLLSRRIRIRLSPPPRAPRRRPARRYRSTAPWRRSGSRTSRVT